MSYCQYYQAHVVEKEAWFLTGVLRSFEHLAFDRTLDKETSTFEFFVTEDLEPMFLILMSSLQEQGVISSLTKMPNRLLDPHAPI